MGFYSFLFLFFKGGAGGLVGGWVDAGQTGTHNGSNRPESWRLKSQAGLFFMIIQDWQQQQQQGKQL